MKVSALNLRLSIVLVCLVLASGLTAENSSFSDPNLEFAGATAETPLSQNDLLRKQLALDRETQKTLTDSLVVSNSEAELFRRKYSELQSRMDALGVESVGKDRAKLEQRLLKAVSDLHLMNKEKEAYREQLLKLTETMLRYTKSAEAADPQARAEVEAQLRATAQHLHEPTRQAVVALGRLVGVGVGAHRDRLAGPGGIGQLALQPLDGVHLDHDPALEVLPRVQAEVLVRGPREAVGAGVTASTVGVDRVAEGHPRSGRQRVDDPPCVDRHVLDAGQVAPLRPEQLELGIISLPPHAESIANVCSTTLASS